MTGAELVLAVKRHVGNISTTGTLAIDDSWYVDRVNEGYRRVCTYQGPVTAPGAKSPMMRRVRFSELYDRLTRTLTTGGSTNFFANQASVYNVVGLYDRDNDRPIIRKSRRDFMRRDPEATGSVTIWTPDGEGDVRGYRVWRIPSVALSIYEYVYKSAETLANDATAPVIPEEWHVAIEYAAAAAAASRIHNSQRANELEAMFRQQMSECQLSTEDPASYSRGHYSMGSRGY